MLSAVQMFTQQQPQASAAPAAAASVRVFVTQASAPGSAAQIVMVNPGARSMAEVLAAVCAKFGIAPSADMSLQLDGVGVQVASPSEISANDKLVLVQTAPPSYLEKE